MGAAAQTRQRIGYIDALKGFTILCVVLGHIVGLYFQVGAYPESSELLHNVCKLIYMFHMPLFMMLSGYLYYTAYFNDNGTPDRNRVYRQIYNQIGFYIILSIAIGVTKALLSSLTSGVLIAEITFLDIALIWIRPIDICWYLYVLIILYLIFSISRLTEINRWVLLAIFAATAVYSRVILIPWFEIRQTLYYAIFFFIGITGKKYRNWIIGNKYLTIALFVAAFGSGVMIWNEELNTSNYANLIYILNIVAALGISLSLWYVFEHIKFIGKCRIWQLCGRHSLEIYAIHTFFVAGLRLVFPKIGIHNVYISIVLNLFISTTIPLLFSTLCKKLYIHELFFKPVTYVIKRKLV